MANSIGNPSYMANKYTIESFAAAAEIQHGNEQEKAILTAEIQKSIDVQQKVF
jgi:hypothetical protein